MKYIIIENVDLMSKNEETELTNALKELNVMFKIRHSPNFIEDKK
jgi:hypothetical protein